MLWMATDQTAQRLEATLKALADPLRLRILALVAEHEVCVCYLVEVLHTVQPVVSSQLAYLRGLDWWNRDEMVNGFITGCTGLRRISGSVVVRSPPALQD